MLNHVFSFSRDDTHEDPIPKPGRSVHAFRTPFAARPPVFGRVEAMEPRTLMAAALLHDINLFNRSPKQIVDANGTAFFVNVNAQGGDDLYKLDHGAAAATLLRSFPPDRTYRDETVRQLTRPGRRSSS